MKKIMVLLVLSLSIISCDIIDNLDLNLQSVYKVEFTAEADVSLDELPYEQTLYLTLVGQDKSVQSLRFTNTSGFEQEKCADLCVTYKGVIDEIKSRVEYESTGPVLGVSVNFYYLPKDIEIPESEYPDLNVTMKVYKKNELIDTQKITVNFETISDKTVYNFEYPKLISK